jgi:hypothetical protein
MAKGMHVRLIKARKKGPEFDEVVLLVVEKNPGLANAELAVLVNAYWRQSTKKSSTGLLMVTLRMNEALARLQRAGLVDCSVADLKRRWWAVRAEEGGAA